MEEEITPHIKIKKVEEEKEKKEKEKEELLSDKEILQAFNKLKSLKK